MKSGAPAAPGVDSRLAVIELLSDGALHSGQRIAEALGITRSAVWKHVQGLEALGLAVQAVPGRGYRLDQPLELLSPAAVEAAAGGAPLASLDVLAETDSTNARLLACPPPLPGTLHVCIAEMQSAGRGRRGRAWAAPFGGGLYLSAAWQFDPRPAQFGALSLVAGLAARDALARCGVHNVGLKWPNDLVWAGGKLGGILVELRAEADGPAHAVIGTGINVYLPAAVRAAIEPAWGRGPVDLVQATGAPVSRNRLAGELVASTARLLQRFTRDGFAPFVGEFVEADWLRGREVSARGPRGPIVGRAEGVADDGTLQVRTAGGLEPVHSGEVSLTVTA